MTTATSFDLDTLRRATEERDSETLLSLYADNAEATLVDTDHPPSSPRVMHGKAEIGEYLRDIYGRDMTHSVRDAVQSDGRAAFATDCRYPDGSRVSCMSTLELQDGRIARQSCIQVWDQ